MTKKAIDLNSGFRRVVLMAAAAAAAVFGIMAAVWAFGNSVSRGADSIEIAALAKTLAPGDPQTHYSLAVLSEKTFIADDLQTALSEYEKAAALSPSNYLFWLDLAAARERTGDRGGAESALRRAKSLAPNYAAVQWALGNVLLRKGETDEGFAEIRSAVAGNGKYTNAAAAMAWQVLGGDMGAVRQALGDSPKLSAALAIQLAGESRFDESYAVWNLLSYDNKLATMEEAGMPLARKFAAAGKFRNAFAVARIAEAAKGNSIQFGEISNGGFEEPLRAKEPGIFDWQIGDGAVPRIGQTDGQWHNGAFGLLVSFGSDASGFRHISQTIAVEPGAKYRFELFYRSDIRSLGSLKWVIADAHSGAELAATRPLAAAGNWTETDADITVPDNIDGIVIRLDRDGCTGECTTSGSIWFDDVSLKRR